VLQPNTLDDPSRHGEKGVHVQRCLRGAADGGQEQELAVVEERSL
jgi:hypothetical protein